MTLFVAEMGYIYDRSRVGGNEAQSVSGLEAIQALAGFEHRQRTQKPRRVEFIFGHAGHYSEPRLDLLCRCA